MQRKGIPVPKSVADFRETVILAANKHEYLVLSRVKFACHRIGMVVGLAFQRKGVA